MAEVNAIERLIVAAAMERKGIKHYEVRPGNDCVWVSWGRINAYFVIRNGKIVDEIYD